MSEPLIYTTKGNVPISSLTLKHFWEDGLELEVKPTFGNDGLSLSVEKNGQMTYVEEYYDKETNELVKRNVAVYRFKGLDLASDAGQLG